MEQIIVGIASLIILPMFYGLLIRWKEKEEKKNSYNSEFMVKPSKGLTLFFFIFMMISFLGMVGAVLFYCLTNIANKNLIFWEIEIISLSVFLLSGTGLLSNKYDYFVVEDDGVRIKKLLKKEKFIKYSDIVYVNYSSNIGQLFCCDRDGVTLFVVERYYVGVEQLYHELSKRGYASLPQPYPSEEMKKNKRFQYMKKISTSIMGFWLFLLFGLSSLLLGGLIHAQAHFTPFENYEVSGIIENYSLNNGTLKIDLVGDDKTYYVDQIVYEKLDKDVYYVLAKNEEIKLYIAYQDEYERYHISQIELQHVIYLHMEEAESALYSNYKTSKIVSYVFLGIGTVLEILALVDIVKIKILKNQPCPES